MGEKLAKGYTPSASGTPYQQTRNEDRATGIVPQLLNPIDDREAEKLIADPAWWAQEKFDGKRVLIRRVGDQITGINRGGLVIALPEAIVDAARSIGRQQWLMDGEAVSETFFAFDLLESAGGDLRDKPYSDRLKELENVAAQQPGFRIASTAKTMEAKQAFLNELKRDNAEGIVFKRSDASYTPGRPNSGGTQVKFKFTQSCSCIVAGMKGSRRSVALTLVDGDRTVPVGNVTIPSNHRVPTPGQIVEIRYLYAYPGGSLYQPVYLGPRDDLNAAACVLAQLRYRAANEDDA